MDAGLRVSEAGLEYDLLTGWGRQAVVGPELSCQTIAS